MTTPPASIDRQIAHLFSDGYEITKQHFSLYQTLYDLPVVSYTDSDLTQEALEYCRRRRFFVTVLPYTTGATLFLTRVFADKKLGWLLPGGSIHVQSNELIHEAVLRQFRRALATGALHDSPHRIELGELDPVAYMVNTFSRGEDAVEHHGIAFIARVRSDQSYLAELRDRSLIRGHFIPLHRRISLSQYGNDAVFRLGLDRIQNIDLNSVPEAEIVDKPPQWRLSVHHRVVKPLFRLFSHVVGRDPVNRVNERILKAIRAPSCPQTCIDVSCGDNQLILTIARDVPVCVANDVAWDLVHTVYERRLHLDPALPKDHIVIPTNHDCAALPFGDAVFDVSLCKNTLHHMGGSKKLHGLLSSLTRITKHRIVIVEIMDPNHEPRWALLRHAYYLRFLKEGVGQAFFARDDFRKVIGDFFEGYRISFDELRTLRGVFLIAVIDLQDDIES